MVLEDKKRGVWGGTQAARKRKKKEQEEKKKGPGYLTLSLFGLWGLHSFVTISCTQLGMTVLKTPILL